MSIYKQIYAQFNLKDKAIERILAPHTVDQLQTVNKVLQAKDSELQTMQKVMKGSQGEAFHEYPCTLIYMCVCVFLITVHKRALKVWANCMV